MSATMSRFVLCTILIILCSCKPQDHTTSYVDINPVAINQSIGRVYSGQVFGMVGHTIGPVKSVDYQRHNQILTFDTLSENDMPKFIQVVHEDGQWKCLAIQQTYNRRK